MLYKQENVSGKVAVEPTIANSAMTDEVLISYNM